MRIGYISSDLSAHHKKAYNTKLEAAGCKKIIKGTGSLKRDETGALDEINPGDVLVVVTLDQLASSIRELSELFNELAKLRVAIESLSEKINTGAQSDKLFTKHLNLIWDFQRALHQKSIDRAKAEGNVGGRPAVMNEKSVAGARKLYAKGQTPASEIAEKYNVSLSTLYRYLAK